MNIVLACAGGFSTTMLMENMKKVIRESKKLDINDYDIEAMPIDMLEVEATNADVVLVGPQVAHREAYVKSILNPKNIPYVIIDKDVYGDMDGATVVKLALIAYRKVHQGGK